MDRVFEKLLPILLALLLGILPVQNAFSAMGLSTDSGDMTHHSTAMDMSMQHSTDEANHKHHCDHCNANDCCGDSSCLNAHCQSLSYIPPVEISSLPQPESFFLLTLLTLKHSDYYLSTLFRPPRH